MLLSAAGFSLLSARQVQEAKVIASLRKMFGDSVSVRRSVVLLTPEERSAVRALSASAWRSDSVEVFTCKAAGGVAGYGIPDNVMGKAQFITYLVGLTPAGVVRDVDVLAYREAYGGEIAYESFRKQFREKTAADRLQPGKDIKNISGATISVRAITLGVKRIVSTFERIRGRIP